MVSREATFGRLDYTALPLSSATWDDLDPLEFHRLKQAIRDRHGDETLLELSDLYRQGAGFSRSERRSATSHGGGITLAGERGIPSQPFANA